MYVGIFCIGPGLYNATRAIISSSASGVICFNVSCIPGLSNWKIPVVSPLLKKSNVFKSVRSILLISKSIPWLIINWTQLSMRVRVFSPRKSNFTSPAFSTCFISNCVRYVLVSGSLYNGTSLKISSFEITTPAAWIDVCLFKPSSLNAISRSFSTFSSLLASSDILGSLSMDSCKVNGLEGSNGINLHK